MVKHDVDTCRVLEHGLLRLYKQAVAQRRWEVAEHLLRALEELARSEPACQLTVDQAYLRIPHRQA